MSIKTVTDENFETEVVTASTPVMVDFYADWCGPCQAMAPILDELSQEMVGQVAITKLNIDDHPHSAGRFGVRSIPTFVLFKDGKPVATQVGGTTKTKLKEWILGAL